MYKVVTITTSPDSRCSANPSPNGGRLWQAGNTTLFQSKQFCGHPSANGGAALLQVRQWRASRFPHAEGTSGGNLLGRVISGRLVARCGRSA